jgi:hypothetical protein
MALCYAPKPPYQLYSRNKLTEQSLTDLDTPTTAPDRNLPK